MIIVPVDGSSQSLNALDFAIMMAVNYQDKLLLLNVQPKREANFSVEVTDDEQWGQQVKDNAKRQLEEAIAFVEGKVPYSTKMRIGIPSIEITTEAKETHATSIVMGSRGNGPVVSAILGSVSYGVLHLSPCPVTVVPGQEKG
ncbi:universal stress protein [Salipaludibacillus sp. HK11]|uniref:universal stress protein n=1 Tax=Salipaludibacillus sp. HK11 TaxID=3394320 RepID=UPI0039FC86C3